MAFVPGYSHDVFLSYAHGDDQDWIQRFVDRLRQAVKLRLGVPINIWVDEQDAHRSRNFAADIPDALTSSAVFLLLPSPIYIRSAYSVGEECRVFRATLPEKRRRFDASEFANELFVFSCPIMPVENNEHWDLFPGATDTNFFDERGRFGIDSPKFEVALAALSDRLIALLKRMRNHLTPVFLYPHHPSSDLADIRNDLAIELSRQGYRVLPDREVFLDKQVRESAVAVFLLGSSYGESTLGLAQIASQRPDKPWFVWTSPTVADGGARTLGLARLLEQLESRSKTFLNEAVGPEKLKEEVLSALKPIRRDRAPSPGKPRVYVVYNARDRNESANAGLILLSDYKRVVDFDEPDDPALHTERMMRSDGVLLVWGSADLGWYTQEFTGMMHGAPTTKGRGVCLFQPLDRKEEALRETRQLYSDLFISEQIGPFDAGRLDSFFRPLLQRPQPGA